MAMIFRSALPNQRASPKACTWPAASTIQYPLPEGVSCMSSAEPESEPAAGIP
jgi:hypothetical protein